MYTKDIDIHVLPIYNDCVSTVHVTVILLTKFLVLDLNHLKGIKSHLFQLQSLNHLDNKTNFGTYLNSWTYFLYVFSIMSNIVQRFIFKIKQCKNFETQWCPPTCAAKGIKYLGSQKGYICRKKTSCLYFFLQIAAYECTNFFFVIF